MSMGTPYSCNAKIKKHIRIRLEGDIDVQGKVGGF